jgi:hypothetical protein
MNAEVEVTGRPARLSGKVNFAAQRKHRHDAMAAVWEQMLRQSELSAIDDDWRAPLADY